uniref:Uncharacterized protein n=1 Tax=Romanomermis culicivorax TaxID=13658 RepID=A0A915J099_ROMCU
MLISSMLYQFLNDTHRKTLGLPPPNWSDLLQLARFRKVLSYNRKTISFSDVFFELNDLNDELG